MGPTDPTDRLPQLQVEHSDRGGAHVLALTGELDLRSGPRLEAALASATAEEHACVCLDLTNLDFIDSTGLAIVIRAQQAATAAGRVLAVVCGPGAVRRTFEMTGLLLMLSVVGSVDEVLTQLEGR